MRALFISRNLLGDGLYISPALNQWYKEHLGAEVTILTHDDFIKSIYSRMGVPLNVVTEANESDFDFVHTFNVEKAFLLSDQKQCHVAESYAELLGVKLQPRGGHKYGHLKPIFIPTGEEVEDELKGNVLVSMFSASCASREGKPPNKMLPWHKWEPILRYLRKEFDGVPIRFLGSPTDRAPLSISEDEYLTGVPMNKLALIMRHARLLFTLDNGMSHLAASQETPTFLLYPRVLGLHYIAPVGNPNVRIIHMDPNIVHPMEIIKGLKMVVPQIVERTQV